MRVKDVAPPVVTFCPQSKSVFLKAGRVKLRDDDNLINLLLVIQTSEKVYWREPKFSDNVKIVQVAARTLPGKEFSLGKHVIDYEVRQSRGLV